MKTFNFQISIENDYVMVQCYSVNFFVYSLCMSNKMEKNLLQVYGLFTNKQKQTYRISSNRRNLLLFQSKNFLYLNYFSTKNVSYLKENL